MSAQKNSTGRRRDRLAAAARTLPGARLAAHVATAVVHGDVTDRAMTLAAQAFTGILPVVIFLMTLPGSSVIGDSLDALGIPPTTIDLGNAPSSTTFGLVGAAMTIIGATSLSRALGRMYVAVWSVRRLPLLSAWRWIVVLLAIPAAITVQGLTMSLIGGSVFGVRLYGIGLAGGICAVLLTLVIWSATWTVIPRLLVSDQLSWRFLAVNGAATGGLITVFLVVSRYTMPHIAAPVTAHYGTLGLVFVALGWLFVFCGILVTTTIVVHTIATDDGALGRRLRTFAAP